MDESSATPLDQTSREAGDAALKAFAAARAQGWSSVECYRAGVAAWRRIHPEHAADYAAKRAVSVILFGLYEPSRRGITGLTGRRCLLLHRGMKGNPDLSAGKMAARAERDERLARALRENLHRRKVQARAQKHRAGGDSTASPALSESPVSSTNRCRGSTTAD